MPAYTPEERAEACRQMRKMGFHRWAEMVEEGQPETHDSEMVRCEGCGGAGTWQTECCSGAYGCSCGGGLVEMGVCLVCHGAGMVPAGTDMSANSRSIKGICYVGSGPRF